MGRRQRPRIRFASNARRQRTNALKRSTREPRDRAKPVPPKKMDPNWSGSEALSSTLADLRVVDVLDIVIVAGLCWVLISWVREARARVAVGGVAVIGLLFWASS